MASQAGLHVSTHSGAETALSGAGSHSQGDGMAVDSPASPLAAGSQASVGPTGEQHPSRAAGSAVYASSLLLANDSAMSAAGAGVKHKDANEHKRSRSSSRDAQGASLMSQIASELENQQQAGLPAVQQGFPTASAAPALVSEVQGQNHGSHSPYPHCNLSAVRRNASAATSVEAVQQGGEDEDVQGGLAVASNHAGGSATSVPATSYSRRQQGSHYSSMPVALSSRQQSPAYNKATSAVPIERGHSVVYDSEFQHAPRSPSFQQHIGVPAAASGHKRQRTDSDTASPAHQQQAATLVLSPECREASQGHVQVAQHHETCQAAPETTQQATIQEAVSGQQYDEEAQQSAHTSPSGNQGQAGDSPSVSLGLESRGLDLSLSEPALLAHANAHLSASLETSGADMHQHMHQQPTASNDGLVAGGSYNMQLHPAASVHATSLEEDCLASDAETDLSCVGIRPGRRQHDKGTQHEPDMTVSPAPGWQTEMVPSMLRSDAGNSQATSQHQL